MASSSQIAQNALTQRSVLTFMTRLAGKEVLFFWTLERETDAQRDGMIITSPPESHSQRKQNDDFRAASPVF